MEDLRDVFLCHASEDKEAIVRPLISALQEAEISYWVDEVDIGWGESFTQKIGKGLTVSRYVIPIISSFFVGKPWPEYELDAALGLEASGEGAKVLPLLVGDHIDLQTQVKRRYPFLRNRKFLFWNGNPQPVIKALRSRLRNETGKEGVDFARIQSNMKQRSTYIPKLSKAITQRDRDRYLKTAFDTLREYFRRAVEELQAHHEEIDADFVEVDKERFRCRLYLRGELQNECLIRIGAWTTRDSIGYTESTSMLRENSYNEIIRIADDESDLYLSFTMGSFPYSDRSKHFDPEEAAEALWRRFVSPLERK